MFIILTSRGSSSLAHMVLMPLLQTRAIWPLTLQFRQTEFLNMRSKYICESVKYNSYYTFCRYAQRYENEKDC